MFVGSRQHSSNVQVVLDHTPHTASTSRKYSLTLLLGFITRYLRDTSMVNPETCRVSKGTAGVDSHRADDSLVQAFESDIGLQPSNFYGCERELFISIAH